ncbi:hypothetical protein [Rheinheimera tangshanensis]|uniref:DUF2946 domain-containing protein n=1 Tax=Rheinheimera tangshanensis TaxID=400153 RepID=A0A5C8M2U1_9GAMM|nr:hypothetical protein [Rheinheimera tangshanensis]TXK82794.1 hypothetical protein FU839_00425 [Rheinheimera tangshanensis]GGM48986.1 hypothetical protein GCM10010920_06740 [Rheinheimera tangshanensis]
MNRNQGQTPWLRLMVLISLLLFKGVASAAMLCCGPDHSSHSTSSSHHPNSGTTAHQMSDHRAHSTEQHAEMMEQQDQDSDLSNAGHKSSCPGCAISCASAVLIMDPCGIPPEKNQTERIFSSTSFLFPLTSSGLERPPRLYS